MTQSRAEKARDLQHPITGYRGRMGGVMSHPEAQISRGVVTVPEADFTETNYVVAVVRTPGEDRRAVFTVFAEWQDRNGDAFQIVLPGEVIARIAGMTESLTKKHRSRVAKQHANPDAFRKEK